MSDMNRESFLTTGKHFGPSKTASFDPSSFAGYSSWLVLGSFFPSSTSQASKVCAFTFENLPHCGAPGLASGSEGGGHAAV